MTLEENKLESKSPIREPKKSLVEQKGAKPMQTPESTRPKTSQTITESESPAETETVSAALRKRGKLSPADELKSQKTMTQKSYKTVEVSASGILLESMTGPQC